MNSESKYDNLMKIIKEKLMAENVQNQNANVDEHSFGGRKFEAAGMLLKDIAMENYISPDVAQAFRDNKIYIHDMDNYVTGMHNCCKRDTKFITDKGVYSFLDFNDGDEIVVRTHLGNWKKAIVHKLGVQMLNKISFCRSQNVKTGYFTANHRWILQDGTITENVKVGDKLFKAPTFHQINFDTLTNKEKKIWCLGFILGDGVECSSWSHGKKREDVSFIRLRLCGDKTKYIHNFDVFDFNYRVLENGDFYLTFSSKNDLHKKMPNLDMLSIKEKQILFQGLYAADGSHTSTNMSILTTNEEIASFIEDILPSCGYYILKINDLTGEKTNFGVRGFTKEYRFISQENKYYWTIIDIEPYQEEEVWCLDVEEDHSFILPNGIVTGNCLFIDFAKLFKEGFTTRNGDVRPPKSISTAMQQVAVIFQCQSQVQFGGVASAHIDFDLAPFVAMSFKKHLKDGLKYVYDESVQCYIPEDEWKINNEELKEKYTKAYNYAINMLEKEGLQAAQGLYHNLNTLESRAGSQLPFTSINFGRDTSPEGRLITKWLLNASLDGIGKFHKTSIFPIAIFQYKKGVNANPGDPNYDLKQLAIKSLCKRIYPNFVNCDFSENKEDPENPDTYMATMGKCKCSPYKINMNPFLRGVLCE